MDIGKRVVVWVLRGCLETEGGHVVHRYLGRYLGR